MSETKKKKGQHKPNIKKLRSIDTAVKQKTKNSIKDETAMMLSERFTQSIIDSSLDMIIATDVDRRIVQFNRAAQQTFGYSEIEILGKHIGMLYANEEESVKVNAVMTKKGSFIGEIHNKRKNGDVFTSYLSASTLRSGDDTILGVVGISREITALKKAEKEFAQNELLYRTLFEGAHDAIFTMNKDVFINCNQMTLSMFDCTSKEQIVGHHPWEFSPKVQPNGRESAESAEEKINAALEGKPQRFYWMHTMKDGTPFDAEVSLNRIVLDDKILLQAIVRNVSEQAKAREALKISEKNYRDIIDNAPIGFYKSNLGGKFITVNNALVSILGYDTVEELMEKNLRDNIYYNNRDRDRLISEFETLGHTSDIEVLWKKKDGTPFWIQINFHAVYDDDGTVQYFEGFVRDITKQRNAEEAVKESELRFRSLFDQMMDGMYRSTHAGKFVDINPAMVKMFGYASVDEMMKVDIKRDLYFAEEDRRSNILEVGQEQIEEYLMRRKDGTPIWVEDHGRYIYDDNGNIIFHEGMLRNITERKKSEEALRQSEYWLKESQRVARIGSYVLDFTTSTWTSSPVLDEIFGIESNAEKSVKSWSKIVHPDDREEMDDYFANTIIIDKKPFNKEYKINRKRDGEIRWVWGLGELSFDRDGNLLKMIGTIQDITERNNLQHQLLQLEKVRSIGILAGGIAHDFNNILTIILAYASRIKRGNLTQQQMTENVAAINNAVDRGASLVRQILTFARKTDVSFAPLDISDLIHEVSSMLRETFPKTITIQEVFKAEIPKIIADKSQMHQALINLCVNARDAMPQGGTITIAVDTKPQKVVARQFTGAEHENYVSISISDTGFGMDEATKEKIFDPFFTTKEKGKGTGLGLSVVFGVVQTHSAYIGVDSIIGKGTTFQIFIPIFLEQHGTTVIAETEQQEFTGGNETILLVEDEDMIREIVESNLLSGGYKVIIAKDGQEAVDIYRLRQQEIALVITDIGLPKISGIDEFYLLKKINKDVKVLIASGFYEPNVKTDLSENGAKGFLQKPFVMNELFRMIRETLDQ